MKFEVKHTGTTAEKLIIKSESIIEAECIENLLKYGYKVNGAYIINIVDGQKEFTLYPRASKSQLRQLTNLKLFSERVDKYVKIESQNLIGATQF